jgi:hypothetical protein
MRTTNSGYFPAKITYFLRNEKEVGVGWDDWNAEDQKKEKVFPTFPAPSDNAASMITGKAWAESRDWDATRGKTVSTFPPSVEIDNTPRKYRIVNLESRGNGGRAYKVADDENRYFDLREDVLLDAMLEVGIEPGGKLAGEYVWGRVGAATKLVRVGSELYDNILEVSFRKTIKPFKASELEIGGVYASKSGTTAIYLGQCNSTTTAIKYNSLTGASILYNHQLWLEPYCHVKGTWQEKYDEYMDGDNPYVFEIVKSRKVVDKVDQVNVGNDIFKRVNAVSEKQCLRSYNENKNYGPISKDYYRHWQTSTVCPTDVEPVIPNGLHPSSVKRIGAPKGPRKS